jgi:signal transduction histidine kinase
MPSLTFYQLLSLISGVSTLILGSFVLGKNRKARLNQIFFLFALACSIWLLGSFMMLKSKTDEEAIFWDRIVYVGVVFLPSLAYHVSLLLAKLKNRGKILLSGYFFSFLFLILSRTNHFIEGLYKYNWGVHTQARFFHHIFLIFFSVYFILFFLNIYHFYKKTSGAEKSQAAYFLLASFIMIISSLGFLPAYGIDLPPFSYFATVFFVLILTLAITRYHLFGIKVILTEILVATIGILLMIQIFTASTFLWKIVNGIIFILFSVFGYLLIKATYREIKRKEEAERLAEEWRKLGEAKDQFILSIQHHLRTPLTSIRGYSEMILEGIWGKVPEKIKEKVAQIKKSGDILHHLIESLLEIQQLKVGKEILKKEEVRIEDLVEEVVDELKNQAKEKGLALELEKIPLPKIKVDKLKIKEVLWNSLDNAIKYTQKGKIKIQLKKEEDKIKIEISDTGIGMTKKELDNFLKGKLFERGREAKKLWGPGRGIGLALAVEFIKAHGGKILAKSEGRGKGTTFIIELPIE